jgi:glycosyltransferase involved in cell wall biosynthesis
MNSILGMSISGAEKNITELAKQWKKYDITICIYTSTDGCEKFRDNLHVNYQIIQHPGNLYRFALVGILIDYAIRTVRGIFAPKRDQGSTIFSCSDFFPDVLPAFWTKMRGKGNRWVAFIHLIAPNPFRGSLGIYTGKFTKPSIRSILYYFSQNVAIELMKRYADLVLCVNEETMEYLKNRGVSFSKIKVIDNGVDSELVTKVHRDREIYDACFVGRFHPQKGFLDIPDVWREIHKFDMNAKLAIVGRGDHASEDKLRRKIRSYGLDANISVLGYLPEEEKIGVMKSSKIFLFPSYYEAFPIVVIEALACGLQVVGYDLPCLRRLKGSIVTVPIGRTEALAEAVQSLLHDDKTLLKTSKEACFVSSHYDWKYIAKNILVYLEDLCPLSKTNQPPRTLRPSSLFHENLSKLDDSRRLLAQSNKNKVRDPIVIQPESKAVETGGEINELPE